MRNFYKSTNDIVTCSDFEIMEISFKFFSKSNLFTVLGGWNLELKLISTRYTVGSRIGTLYFACVFSKNYVLFSLFMNITVITVRYFFFSVVFSPLYAFIDGPRAKVSG